MNPNDPKLSEQLTAIISQSSSINRLCCSKKEDELFHALDLIEDAARKAKWRLNDMKAWKIKAV